MDEPRATDQMNPRKDRGRRGGRLRFTNGAHRIAIRGDSHMQGLYRARFGSRAPMVGVQGAS